MRSLALLKVVLINIVLTVCLLEFGLRAQQRFGPLFDLEFRPNNVLIARSNELNHVPPPDESWDANGLRRMEENSTNCSPRLLFMGDSFMQGVRKIAKDNYLPVPQAETIPFHVRRLFRERFGQELCVFNAGFASYSPSIYVPQAKKLIPVVKPDLVVIDVDETDMWDDYYRYRELVIRDANGSVAAVRETPLNVQFIQGLTESTDKTLYLHRLFSKLHFTRVEYPKMVAQYSRDRPLDNLALSKLSADEVKTAHQQEVEFFKRNLEDLSRTVVERMGSPESLLYIHHPHLQHLTSTGPVFNNVASETIREVATHNGIRYYDATEDLKAVFGAKAQDYYIPDDMHFNAAGTQAYAAAITKYLAECCIKKK
jgi:hypothetical protein